MARGSEESSFEARIKQFSRAASGMDSVDVRAMARLTEVVKLRLLDRARGLVRSASGAPVFLHYISDGTPLKTKRYAVAQVGASQQQTRRSGVETVEYLVQYALLRRIDANGVASSVAVLREPLPLTEGNTAPALLSASLSFMSNLRELSHRGLAIHHCCLDRAAYAPLSRLIAQHHSATKNSFGNDPDDIYPPFLLDRLNWVASSGCALHDAHNALKWAAHSQFNDVDLLKDVYVSSESPRNR